jgi:hypothetical protein
MPDMTKPFIMEMDTSKWAVGATLLQKQEDRQIHPCGYLSHTLTQTERNWQIYNRELYAIIYCHKPQMKHHNTRLYALRNVANRHKSG